MLFLASWGLNHILGDIFLRMLFSWFMINLQRQVCWACEGPLLHFLFVYLYCFHFCVSEQKLLFNTLWITLTDEDWSAEGIHTMSPQCVWLWFPHTSALLKLFPWWKLFLSLIWKWICCCSLIKAPCLKLFPCFNQVCFSHTRTVKKKKKKVPKLSLRHFWQ